MSAILRRDGTTNPASVAGSRPWSYSNTKEPPRQNPAALLPVINYRRMHVGTALVFLALVS